MKLLTLNFVTCARKACKSSAACFPLHPRDAELEVVEQDLNPLFIKNILPRVEWDALREIAGELGLPALPASPPSPDSLFQFPGSAASASAHSSAEALAAALETEGKENVLVGQTLRDLHTLLLETGIKEGKLVCRECGHEYAVKEGVANFLLPSHLV